MSSHALLSPSSAHRWLNCPLAPRLEATLPEKPSEYAKEGTIAHSVCEVSAKLHFKSIKKTEYNKVIKKLKTNELWDDEMLRTAETYVEHLAERQMSFVNEPYIAFEVKVDITDLRIRAGAGTDFAKTGKYTGIGVFTIVEVKAGEGSAAGWGLLKAYEENRDGWVSLDYCTRL